ncbi:RbsD/FucU family protein [Oscillibacter sp.]|uniref:RbsD/FucU family protein n=1 Tax=Oscillibacter sp. TaxID=1945593 RepID=UPI0028966E4F|nr:RbsD/FucU family protein [Oscillibacter sp.]
MLTGKLIHPELLYALSRCGHGDKVLIADGNYPLASKTGDAEKVFLGLAPNLPTVTQVLEALLSVCNFEKMEVMQPEDGSTPEIFGEFERLLPAAAIEKLDRWAFYSACGEKCLRVAVSTGEGRTFANVLLTVGCA